MRAHRALAAAAASITFFAVGAGGAFADVISNNVDASVDSTAESMPLNVGGADGSTVLRVIPANGDGKNGCNLTAGSTFVASVSSSDTAVATVSPSSITFTSCLDTKTLTVHPVATGSATISLATVSNSTGGSFDLGPATFAVTVAAPTNQAPTIAVTGVSMGGSYSYGAVPTAGCTVSDKEDGSPVVQPTLSAITGPDAAKGLGSQTATCSYTDNGGLTATSSATYTIIPAASVTTVTCSPTSLTYTGSPLTPCTATVTGSGGLNTTTPVTYGGTNTAAGTATATAAYPGDDTHLASSGSATFTIDKAGSTTTLTCPTNVEWTGAAQTPCSAGVTGAGGLAAPLTPAYSANTAVGTATASASFGGDANHTSSSDSATFEIVKATSVVSITCSSGSVFSGSALEPCTAIATGPGLHESLTVSYTDNTNAGTAHASAGYAGDDTHLPASDATTFAIAAAPTTTEVSCPAHVTFTGDPQTPCTAKVTGPGGLDEALTVAYGANTNAGTATASAAFAAGGNYAASHDSASFTIDKAASAVTLTCDETAVYTGDELTPCTASLSGVGGLGGPVGVVYADNVNAGTASATSTYVGDANHTSSQATKSFTILKASSALAISCPASVTYNGSAQEPCTSELTGAHLTGSPTIGYGNNTNAGTATASASFGGDANHEPSSDSETFAIAKAPSTVTVTCPAAAEVYTGAAHEPCTAVATGAGALSASLAVTYGNNVDAGTAKASASYGGDANHEGDAASASFTIGKAPSTVAITCPASVTFTGSAITPCSASASGVAGLTQPATVTLAYSGNTAVGTAGVTGTYAGDANHVGSSATTTFVINPWQLTGFYQPVDMSGVLNTVKNGSTVPLKFEVFSDGTELTSTAAVKSFTSAAVKCDGTALTDDIEITTTGGTSLRYDSTGGQFIQNWQTPKTVGACYRVTMTTQDNSSIVAYFKLK